MRRFFSGTRVRDGARRNERWRWPLFVLGCPNIEGAKTELAFEHGREDKDGWASKLFGMGFEHKTTLSIKDKIAGTAAPGQHRVLFVAYEVEIIDFELAVALPGGELWRVVEPERCAGMLVVPQEE